ncbi:MAG: M56 family metallopeptidase [Neglectibacter timonensis]
MLECIVTSSVLIMALLVLRRVFRGKLSARLQYALWILAALRLLLPFSLVQSPVSVMNAVEKASQAYSAPPQAQGIEDTSRNPVDLPVQPAVSAGKASESPQAGEPAVNLQDVFFSVWVMGMGVMGLCFVWSNLHFRRKLRRERGRVECPGYPLPVYRSEGILSPCLAGALRPAVYLTPESMETPVRQRHILAHEYTHYLQGDLLWAVLRGVCLSIHWFNPLVWAAAFCSKTDCELACDERTVRRLGEKERLAYGHTLVEMVSCRNFPGIVLSTATTMVSGKKAIRARIQRLAKRPKRLVLPAAAVLLASLLVSGCTFTGAATAERSASSGPEGAVSHPAETVSRQEAAASAFSPGEGSRSETVQIRSLMGTSFTYCEAGEHLEEAEDRGTVELSGLDVTTGQGDRVSFSRLNVGDLVRLEFSGETGSEVTGVTLVNPDPHVLEEASLTEQEVQELMWALYAKNDLLRLEWKPEQGESHTFELADQFYSGRYGNLLAGYRWYRCQEDPEPDSKELLLLSSGDASRSFTFYRGSRYALYSENGQRSWYSARRRFWQYPDSIAELMWEEISFNEAAQEITVPTSVTGFEEVAQSYTEQEKELALHRIPGSRYEAEDFQVIRCEVTGTRDGDDSIFAFTARYAVKPADAERYPQAGNFKPAESGEEGYYTYSLQYLMQRLGDTWRCVNTGTSASGLLEDYERKNGLL